LRSNISLKVAELRLRKCFLQFAELRLRTQNLQHLPVNRLLIYVYYRLPNPMPLFTGTNSAVWEESMTATTWGSLGSAFPDTLSATISLMLSGNYHLAHAWKITKYHTFSGGVGGVGWLKIKGVNVSSAQILILLPCFSVWIIYTVPAEDKFLMDARFLKFSALTVRVRPDLKPWKCYVPGNKKKFLRILLLLGSARIG
jgi:hypothetical protein